MQAMILAAGFGTRLKPYSLIKPKPLFPVLNKPLLHATISRLKSSGFSKITVNCHHLADQIRMEVEDISGVIIQQEPKILGTGGGLREALEHIEDGPLLVTNGDIYHDVDFQSVYQRHLKSGADVTMVLHDCPRFNSVSTAKGLITGFHHQQQEHYYAYTGIQVINPHMLKEIKKGEYSCIIDHYRYLLERGKKITGLVVEDIGWSDMGTPRDYLVLHETLLLGKMMIWPEFEVQPENNLLINEACIVGQGCSFDGWNCVGSSFLGDSVRLSRSVVWDGAKLPSYSRISNAIVIPQ